MTLTACSEKEVMPDYSTLYESIKPLDAYFQILTHLAQKPTTHHTLFNVSSFEQLYHLTLKVIEVSKNFTNIFICFHACTALQSRNTVLLSREQQESKCKIHSIRHAINGTESAIYFGHIVKQRILITTQLSNPHFALFIPRTAINIAYRLLFGKKTEEVTSVLGKGGNGEIVQVKLMDEICAKKTVRSNKETNKKLCISAIKTIAIASSKLIEFYHKGSTTLYSESGLFDCYKALHQHKKLFLTSSIDFVEDMLIGLAKLHTENIGLFSLEDKTRFKAFGKFSNGQVHVDFKSQNCVIFEGKNRRSVKLVDMDTMKRDRELISKIYCTYRNISPDAASTYLGVENSRAVTIYDDSWALGCTLYEIVFGITLYREHPEKSLIKMLQEIASTTQACIDAKINAPIPVEVLKLLGEKPLQAVLDYLKKHQPELKLECTERELLQSQLGRREAKRLIGMMKGLLMVAPDHRLTPDQAHNIYYMAERKLRSNPDEDFDSPISDLSEEHSLLDLDPDYVELKIEDSVWVIQSAVREFLQKIHKRRRKLAN